MNNTLQRCHPSEAWNVSRSASERRAERRLREDDFDRYCVDSGTPQTETENTDSSLPIEICRRKKLIFDALENPKFTWRTIGGIAEETKLTARVVEEIIKMIPEVIEAPYTSKEQRRLFTTKGRYSKFATIWQKVVGSIIGEYV